MNTDSADAPAACRISLKRPRETPSAAVPVLIDLLSDDDGDLVVEPDARPAARPLALAHRAPAAGDRRVARAPLAVDDTSEDEDDEDDEDEMEDSEDSDDPDDNGSDLDGFIVSDSDEDEDDGTSDDDDNASKKKKSAATDEQDSEAEFVPRDDLGDDLDDDLNDDDDDTVSSHATHHDTSSSPIVTIDSDDDDDDDDDKSRRNSAAVAAEGDDDQGSARPSKRTRLDDAEASSVDPGNIVSGKRCRRTTERYMDRHFMEFMVRDVPPSQIAAVFDDEDEYFQSGVSLTDSSDEEDDEEDGDDDGRARDLDSSDYEDMDALSSSRVRRRRGGDAAPALPVRAPASPMGNDLSRPPSTVAALLRSLAAQPGGIRPSVASPRSAPTSRVRPPP